MPRSVKHADNKSTNGNDKPKITKYAGNNLAISKAEPRSVKCADDKPTISEGEAEVDRFTS